MATHDYIISNASGAAVRSDLNNALSAIVSNNSSATEPATTYAYQMWADTGSTPAVMKLRDSTNSSWITLYNLDGTSLAAPSATEIAFNDAGADLDFRIEGDNEANLFYVDAGNDRIGIGTNAPEQVLHLASTAATTLLQFNDSGSGGAAAQCRIGCVGNDFVVLNNTGSDAATTRLKISSAGNVAIGSTSPADKLHVEGGGIRIEEDGGATISYREATSGNAELVFRDAKAATDRAAIDNGGRLIVGGTTSSYTNAIIQTQGAAGYNYISLLNTTAGDGDGDRYSYLNFRGRQSGGEESNLARIAGRHDGTGDDEKGLLEFRTNDGNDGNSGQIRMEIESNGQINMLQISSTVTSLFQNATSGSFSSNVQVTRTTRSSSSGFDFLQLEAASGTDQKFRVRGDGDVFADGPYDSGGADYAEYFEWSDGNTTTEDRRGISVVLDGDKIREAVAGEEPIGVISANPSVVGDSAWNAWNGKYLRDDFGTYILETHNVVSWKETISTEDGEEEVKEHSYEDWNIPADVVVPDDAVISATDENGNAFTHRKLNPDYNPDIEYVSREDRPEWETVGLMGKLRIRKGQVTGSRWIKMRDISDNVEEWLVR